MRRSRSAARLAVMSRAVPATRSGAAVGVALDHAAARTHPDPCAVRRAHAVFGQEQRRLAAHVFASGVRARAAGRRRGSRGAGRRRSGPRCRARASSPSVRAHAAHLAVRQVVVPEHVRPRPTARASGVPRDRGSARSTRFSRRRRCTRATRCAADQQQRRDGVRDQRQRMPPQRRRDVHRQRAASADSTRRRGWWPARGTRSCPAAGACR